VIAPALQHAVDLMNDSHQQITVAHSVIHAEPPLKSAEMLASHRTDNYQVLSAVFRYGFIRLIRPFLHSGSESSYHFFASDNGSNSNISDVLCISLFCWCVSH